jgi:hypothetical protein
MIDHVVEWRGVFRGTDEDPREVGFCETCGREVHDRDGVHGARRDDESYHAHIRAAALACHCCPVCCSPPCDGCLAGGVCDDAACRCDELDEYRRDEDPHA